MIKNVAIGRSVRIKTGALVGQDFHTVPWNDCGEEFIISEILNKDKVQLKAYGYGHKNKYGNGAVYANPKDLCRVVSPVDNQVSQGTQKGKERPQNAGWDINTVDDLRNALNPFMDDTKIIFFDGVSCKLKYDIDGKGEGFLYFERKIVG